MRHMEDLNNYIEFCNYKQGLQQVYLLYESTCILFRSNDLSFLNHVYDFRYVLNTRDDNISICGCVTVIIDKNMFPVRYDHDSYNESEPVPKSHPMYISGVTNTFFEYGDKIVHIYHYPNESINIFDKAHEDYFSIVSSIKDAIKFSIHGIKMIVSSINLRKNVYPMHSSAVAYDGKGYLFLGGSHSGKSTIYMNLVCKGLTPVNDDIVLWRSNEESIVLNSVPTIFRGRDHSNSSIVMTEEYTLKRKQFCNDYDIVTQSEYCANIKLDAIFVPEFGFDETSVSRISSIDVLKKIARACTALGFLEVTDDFHRNFNRLLRCDYYRLKMSNDYNDVCNHIMKVIKERI